MGVPGDEVSFVDREVYINGKPIAEVASELSLSLGSVYVARSRIIARLRAKVEELEAEQ